MSLPEPRLRGLGELLRPHEENRFPDAKTARAGLHGPARPPQRSAEPESPSEFDAPGRLTVGSDPESAIVYSPPPPFLSTMLAMLVVGAVTSPSRFTILFLLMLMGVALFQALGSELMMALTVLGTPLAVVLAAVHVLTFRQTLEMDHDSWSLTNQSWLRKKKHSGELSDVRALADRLERQRKRIDEARIREYRKKRPKRQSSSDSGPIQIPVVVRGVRNFVDRVSAVGILTSEGERAFAIGLEEGDRE